MTDAPPPKLCSCCGRDQDRTGQRYCKACHREYQRRWARQARMALQIVRRAGVSLEQLDNPPASSAKPTA